ncbi:MAG: hypothetical protein WCE79_23605 [Xanthobacteraceae bacterium]
MNSGAMHAMLGAASALLQQGRTIDHLSHPLTVVALVLLIGASAFGVASPAIALMLGLAVLAGLAEAYCGIRVGFDAALFDQLREQATTDLAALDAALVRLGLLPASKSGRPLEQRIRGAQRLFYKQGAAFIIQVALLLCGAAAAFPS